MMVGLVSFHAKSIVMLFTVVVSAVVLTLFVMPYMGKSRAMLDLRPLPVAFLVGACALELNCIR